MSGKKKDDGQTLPSKENTLYKSILKHYELKQYKKGLKICDQILSKFPNHGETTALKGLTLNHLDRKEEGYALVKKGVTLNMKSHVCWHVYGLMYKSDRNYPEAIKCYTNALRWDPENAQILRDLSWLQVQVRDYKAFVETRRKILLQRATKQNWITFSIANHLEKNYDLALSVLDSYLDTLDEKRPQPTYDESEMLMYKAKILEDTEKYDEAIKFLQENKSKILDSISRREVIADLSLRTGKFEDAKAIYLELMAGNPENYLYHRGVQSSILENYDHMKMTGCDLPLGVVDISDEQQKMLAEIYDKLATDAPKVWAHQRIRLDYTSGEEFKKYANEFLQKHLRRGVPSLFSSFKIFYSRAMKNLTRNIPSEPQREQAKEKVAIISDLIESYITSLKSTQKFPGNEDVEAPTVMLWVLLFASKHYDAKGETTKALAAIDEAITHTPTLVDLYQTKAKILKHAGDIAEASKVMVQGRELDQADRYMNSKSTKYLLRNDEIKAAEATIAVFTRHEGDSQTYLNEMQAMWYQIESGYAHLRAGNLSQAFKYFMSVEKHFDDFEEDQYDFHGYCMRKTTLRSYLALIEMEDNVRGNHFFVDAIHGALQCLIEMSDNKSKYVVPDPNAEPDYSNMTAAERKIAKMKAKKAAAKAAKLAEEQKRLEEERLKKEEEEAEKETGVKKHNNRKKREFPEDKDPLGEELLRKTVEKSLDEAHRLSQLLLKAAKTSPVADCIDTYLLAFDVEVRRKKYLQAVKYLDGAVKLVGVKHPSIVCRVAPLIQFLDKKVITYAPWAAVESAQPVAVDVDLDDKLCKLVIMSCSKLVGSTDCNQVVADVSKSNNYLDIVAAGESKCIMNADDKDKALSLVASVPKDANLSIKELTKVQNMLKRFNADQALMDKFLASTKELYPRASIF